ncbi:MAG: chromosome condensation protein [Pirellulales bacterium]
MAPTARPVIERVFPLNLTPFEGYMEWDDRDNYPMTFIVELEFTGKLNRNALEASLPDALARHPLLRAWIGKAKGNRDCWIAAAQPNPKLDFAELGKPIDLPNGERIDLRKEVGLRIWVRYNDERTILTTQFHHATCDGIGSYQFLGDWLWFYAERLGQPAEGSVPEFDPAGIRARNRANYNPDDYRLPNGKIRAEFGELKEVVVRGAIPLSRPSPSKRAESFPGILSTEFDKEQYRRLRLAAESRGQSTNQLLIERLLVTVDRWNELHGQKRSGKYAIMMPMDLRQSSDPNFSAVNVVTYAFLRRSRAELKDPAQLQDSLREEMVHLMHQRHGGPFMNMLASMQGPEMGETVDRVASDACLLQLFPIRVTRPSDSTCSFHAKEA